MCRESPNPFQLTLTPINAIRILSVNAISIKKHAISILSLILRDKEMTPKDRKTPEKVAIGRRLRLARTKAGISAADMAARFHREEVSYRQWENGTNLPAGEYVPDLGRILAVSLDWLFRGKGKGPVAKGEEPDSSVRLHGLMLRVFDAAPPEAQDQLSDYIERLVLPRYEKTRLTATMPDS